MLKKIQATVTILLAGAAMVIAQTGALKITLKDKVTGETIPFANVIVESNGAQAGQGQTNIDGEVIIKPLNPGKYNVKSTYVGYQSVEVTGVTVSADKTAYVEVKLEPGVSLKEFVLEVFVTPLIDPDTKSGKTVDREQYTNMTSKDINSVAATTAGVYQQQEGGAINVRGTRSDATVVFIDGVKQIGTTGVPRGSVEQITAITGGIPAQYGDVTGGIISVTTRGPQNNYSGGVELSSSQFLDAYGFNYLGFSFSGPILTKKDTAEKMKQAVLGFFVGGEVISEKDPDPSSVGVWKVKDDKLKELEESPLRPSDIGAGLVKNADYLRTDDLEHIKAKQNVASRGLKLNAKLLYKLGKNTDITLGGSMDYNVRHQFVWEYALLNPVNNPLLTQNTWNAWGRITQKFGTQATTKEESEKSTSNIKNAYYSLQAGYSRYSQVQEDDTHKDNLFDYGYIGKFQHYKTPYYGFASGSQGDAFYQAGISDSLLTFQAADLNPLGANWTEQVYSLVGQAGIRTDADIQNNLGLLNGDRPLSNNVYSLWYGTGRQYGGYSKVENSQFRIVTSFSADIKKDHAVQVGLEYEQRENRTFSATPIELWTLMRQFTNFHIQNLDTVPILVPELSGTYNYYRFDRKYDAASQTAFDKNLRAKLGMPVTSTQWIDVDSYDPTMYSLDMFSADELLQYGQVGYFGFDHTGKKVTGNPTLDDYLNDKDGNGNYTRLTPAFRPIYMAGYIQDKFDFRDMKFLVGLRVDRFDANQQVLKDKYVFDEVKTAGETNFSSLNAERPSNIGDDYVVYVNDLKNPTGIVGYRNGDVWYNANGTEIADPAVLKTSTGIAPYLVNPNNTSKISAKAFKDYEPQVNLMPRIAFSFPISDVANFFAHYDILTARPTEGSNRLDPTSLYYLEARGGGFTPNPDLKPQRTTDYELGFSQILSEKKNSAITLSAFYKELRDMIQVVNVVGAYPVNYLTYGNIDFGTVKGFSVAYDLRRTAGVQLNANYTLQFADGTGSSASDGINLVSSGVPNLRTPVPLSFDQRHTIVTTFDYRFGSGADYKGPTRTRKKGDGEKTMQLLADMGANLTMTAGSGTPYSRQGNISQGDNGSPVGIGVSQRTSLKGSIRGSQLPWTVRMNLTVNKKFTLTWGGKEDDNKKRSDLNVYMQVFNLLNNRNILIVYRATGNPGDDGYLQAAEFQAQINGQTDSQSYRDLYAVKVNDPNHYDLPRRIRLGLSLSF